MRLWAGTAAMLVTAVFTGGAQSAKNHGPGLLSIDHYVRVKSTVPSMAGQFAQIYVRERVKAEAALRGAGAADRVVLFVHGAGTRVPAMIVAGVLDKQVPPERARALFDDLGSTEKVFVDLGCSSHNAMWEGNHLLMFAASLEWLTKGAIGEVRNGVVRIGY